MSQITTRSAMQYDLPKLLAFEQGIINFERPFDSTLKDGEINYYPIEKMINSDDAEVIVAECDGQLVGSGFARILAASDYLKHQYYASLRFMYVDEAFRGRGVNGLVINALKSWCRQKNISELRLTVYTPNQGAIKAYEKAGFSSHMLEMRCELD